MAANRDNESKRTQRPQFNHLLEQMDSFFNDSIKNFNSMFKKSIRINTYETKSSVVIEAELPGYKREQIHLEIIGNQIRISAEDTTNVEEKNENYNNEESVRQAERLVTLPFTISEKDTKAKLNNGLLKITVPKLNESRKFIDIDD
ncbi:Hsp20/alpha crystallin family protein [Lentibacillus sp. Marseille-P4043]|uniref:Hsp20/alpha crystallin family protein n=1 Tax=Lentibacillus sp. Marseille-P4043 TaxID=2040293 RepID=UPI00131A4961|nr:Hsp20/alpha crystallin family protein [Lentibacillus sp. Marseille-P4043]